jgi:hypothetical protein
MYTQDEDEEDRLRHDQDIAAIKIVNEELMNANAALKK